MVFSSYIFVLLFLPVTVTGYFVLSRIFPQSQIVLGYLTLMSLVFYSYNNIRYVPVIVSSILVNWIVSRLFYKNLPISEKCVLLLGLLFDIGLIFYFKYTDFFLENMNALFHRSYELKEIVLPLGISFFTFQQISFLVDSYRKETASYHFWEYATFVSFFPQLVAGPIVLHDEMIPQFRDFSKRKCSPDNLVIGIQMFTFGLFKKVLIADTFAKAVSWGFTNFDAATAADFIVVMLSYTFQIYFDFSGYSDMATGIARMLNIHLPINFDSPYQSYSIREFWRRWHITLTRFLTKYIYIPLGGNRKGAVRTCINILIVFAISGLWHGANWTFILWGLLHGFFSVTERLTDKFYQKINPVLQWLYTFGVINMLWLLFRSDSVGQWLMMLKRILLFGNTNISDGLLSCFALREYQAVFEALHLSDYYYALRGFGFGILLLFAIVCCLGFPNNYRRDYRISLATMLLTSVVMMWCVFSLNTESVFIYFNF